MRAARLLSWGILLVMATAPRIVAGPSPVSPDPLAEQALLEKALAEFARGQQSKDDAVAAEHFARAADAFAQLHQRGVHNPALYENQVHAELLAGHLAHALLACHRGLRLAPNHSDLRAHRDYLRSKVQYASAVGRPQPSAWPHGWPQATLPFTLAVFFLLFGLACFTLTRWFMTRQGRWLFRTILLLILTLATGLGVWIIVEQADYESREPLVVVAAPDGAPFHRGNGSSFPRHDLSTLPLGLEARRLYQRGDWLQIQLSTGEIGWVEKSDVVVDESD